MTLKEDVTSGVQVVLDAAWKTEDATVIPETDDVALSNGAKLLDATYLASRPGDRPRHARHSADAGATACPDEQDRVAKARRGPVVDDARRSVPSKVSPARRRTAADARLRGSQVP